MHLQRSERKIRAQEQSSSPHMTPAKPTSRSHRCPDRAPPLAKALDLLPVRHDEAAAAILTDHSL